MGGKAKLTSISFLQARRSGGSIRKSVARATMRFSISSLHSAPNPGSSRCPSRHMIACECPGSIAPQNWRIQHTRPPSATAARGTHMCRENQSHRRLHGKICSTVHVASVLGNSTAVRQDYPIYGACDGILRTHSDAEVQCSTASGSYPPVLTFFLSGRQMLKMRVCRRTSSILSTSALKSCSWQSHERRRRFCRRQNWMRPCFG